ncbi:putative salicylaldehyde dehydrogenase [Calycina marina]|uniref:Salicylaldehyde dehydrogenase n=1 Tax=Calycina marina TaxID=1763456 RepID=A0A9P8CDS1_9HELO|nr:putative salicylaldehyde dehydrogenase [Calycina marina]
MEVNASMLVPEAVHTTNAANGTIPLIINNKAHETESSFPVHNPATGKFVHNFSSASIADANLAISSCQKAFLTWRNVRPAKKRDIFLKAAELMEQRKEELARYLVDETGAAQPWGNFNLGLAPEILRDIAGRLTSITGSIPTTATDGLSALIYKEPYGVILAIAPWNAAYILGIRSIAYAIAAGNTAILKAPEFSPMCSHAMVQLFVDAGLPPGVLNLLAHKTSDAAAVTKHLIQSPSVKKINFTGSTAVGRIIARLAGENLKPVLLELGGKAPAIVWEDADLGLAAKECAVGAFLHSGQICMSTERIIVHEKVVDAFEKLFKTAIDGFAPEHEDAGVLINKAGVEKNARLLKDAVEKGAKVLYGDVCNGVEAKMRPVVVKGTSKEMDLFYTESFGPTVSLMVVKTEEEALELANDTEYGLSSAVFTRDLATGLRFAKNIESGAVHINNMTVHDETALPHGGMKDSGYGRFGASGLDEWVRSKTVTFRD